MSQAGPHPQRRDDAFVGCGCAVVALLCLVFRYLPVVDLPQHAAMVSIIANRSDPAFGFAERFTVDWLTPYATVYAFGAALAHVLPLRLALGIAAAACTVAPVVGAWLLLRACDRPRIWAALALPLAFGYIWHWGFLNFLLGLGLFQATLATIVTAAARPTARDPLVVAALALLTAATHLHAFALLALFAPLFATSRPRLLAALAPGALLTGWFLARSTGIEGAGGTTHWFGPLENALAFPLHLAGGFREPWPHLVAPVLMGIAAWAWILPAPDPSRPPTAARWLLAGQLLLYFALPADLEDGFHVSPRQALAAVLAGLLILPPPRRGARWAIVGVAAASLLFAATQLRGFDREARSFDAALDAIPRNQRVAGLIFEPLSDWTHTAIPPYLQFSAWVQAERGGDVAFSFAELWNIPVGYRPGLPPHRGKLKKHFQLRPESLAPSQYVYFDYLLYRQVEPSTSAQEAALPVVRSGPWTVMAVASEPAIRVPDTGARSRERRDP